MGEIRWAEPSWQDVAHNPIAHANIEFDDERPSGLGVLVGGNISAGIASITGLGLTGFPQVISADIFSAKGSIAGDVVLGWPITITPDAFETTATFLATGVGGVPQIVSGNFTATAALIGDFDTNMLYGILSIQGNSTGETTVDATPRQIAAWNTNGVSNGMTVDHTDDTIRADTAGTYLITVSLSFNGTGNKNYQCEIYTYDDSATTWNASGFALERKIGSGGDTGDTSVVGIVALDVNDKVTVYQSTTDGGSAFTVTEGQLAATRLGD